MPVVRAWDKQLITRRCFVPLFDQGKAAAASAEASAKALALIEGKHGVLLEMLGAKEERVEELQEDLREVKGMYQEQIARLVDRLNKAEADPRFFSGVPSTVGGLVVLCALILFQSSVRTPVPVL